MENYRSAIAYYWKSILGYEIPENDQVLSDLFRGFKRERPFPSKHVVQWDILLVLKFLQSPRFRNTSATSDKDITLKTAFLLAMASGKRGSELHALQAEVEWLSQCDKRFVRLRPNLSFVSKTHLTSGGKGVLVPFTIPALPSKEGVSEDDLQLCPVRTLEFYLNRVKSFRTSNQKAIIISYQRGHEKDLHQQTLSRYIKELIVLAHTKQDPTTVEKLVVRPHSVRHVATSLHALRSCSLDELLKAGAWASSNVFLSHYAQSFSTSDLSQLADLGGFVTAGVVF